MTLFPQIRSYSEILGVGTSTNGSGGEGNTHNIQYLSQLLNSALGIQNQSQKIQFKNVYGCVIRKFHLGKQAAGRQAIVR